MKLKALKADVIQFLEEKQLKMQRGNEDYEWVRASVYNLRKEIDPKAHTKQKPRFGYNPAVVESLVKKYDFTDRQALIFATLLNTKDSPTVLELAMATDLERGTTYRTVEELRELGVIMVLGFGVLRYTVTDRDRPLDPMVKRHADIIEKLKDFDIQCMSAT